MLQQDAVISVHSPETRPLPLVLAFNDLTYKVTLPRRFGFRSRRSPAQVKTLLNGITGETNEGEILAILGASGSGKSTLIDALAGRISEGSLKGTVTLNGEALQSRMLQVISAYVMQDDLLFPMLTVQETLMFAAEFRLPRSLPKSKKRDRVETLIDQLGLRTVKNTMIGDEGHRGVSGGERRRVSIGTDIIHDPIVLFLDEPTSGLDSTCAFMVVQVLKKIACSGSIVVMSIHQPSCRIMEFLDRLLVLSSGQCVFSDSPATLPLFFSEFGRPIPDKENNAEFTLDLIKDLEGTSGGTSRLVEFNRSWQQKKLRGSQEPHHNSSPLRETINASITRGKLVTTSYNSKASYVNPWWVETLILAKRYMINWTRTPELIGTRVFIVMMTGFLLATVYWRVDDSPRGVQERLSFFSFAMATMFYSCADGLPTFIQERYIFMRETAHNAYRRSSYVISHSLVTLPHLFALSVGFAATTFWFVGLNGGLAGFIYYLLIIFASFWSGCSFVTFVSGVIPNVMMSYMVTFGYLSYCLLFSGFYINRDRIHLYWIWIHYISLLKYPYEAVLHNEFDDPSRLSEDHSVDNATPYHSMEIGSSLTLGQLLKNVSDVRKVDAGDETPLHSSQGDQDYDDLMRPVPFVLSFNNLTYNVSVRRKFNLIPRRSLSSSKTKTLLDNISGETRDGEILAVLGASGSGKSTLIDALANRIAKGSLKGKVTLNGEPLQSRTLKVISAYVMQDDLLFPMLTVEETLMFAAEFRLPRSLPKSKKKLRVQTLIEQLGIKNAANTIIGDEGHRGISGGERRRVSIGIDIIHDPIVLFLDEPTSGLDSTSAFMVVNVLKKIAESGSIVIMSIHQPSHRVLGLLNRLIFLSRGKTVFSGSPASLPGFFARFGSPVPENENQTEFALDLIRELEGSAGGTRGLVEFNKRWQEMKNRSPPASPNPNLTLKEAISASISRGKLVSGGGGGSSVVSHGGFANPFWIEIKTLTERSILNSRRQPELFGTRLAAVLVTGFILATVFWRLDNSPKGVQERLGFFAFAMSTMFYTCADALPVFLQERYIFMRETAYNAYRRSSYVLSHAVVSLPSLVFLSLAFASTTFWAVGLEGGPMGFLFYCLIIFASFWSGSSFVTFLSGVVPHVMLGYTIVVAILAYFLLFSGFFINRDRIPQYWLWFHYLSLVKYPYEAVLQNEFSDPMECFVRGVQMFDNTPLGQLSYGMKLRLLDSVSRSIGMRITSSTCLTTGADILRQQGVTELSKWSCLLVTVGFGFFFRALFYLCLLFGSKNKRR
ncbi:unnamed protein product [Brassica napus]|uniref:(rape) hypothetical protein n=1 Tax=Brassica napus TaxID=3708 RepID=A0A817AWD0_BRANA|nr:unnamed protein product [Brassica napus]